MFYHPLYPLSTIHYIYISIGKEHRIVSLKILASEQRSKINSLIAEAYQKQSLLASSFKESSRSIGDFDAETDGLLHDIHTAKEKQVVCCEHIELIFIFIYICFH